MKNTKTFDEFVNEDYQIDEGRFKGKQLYPNWISPDDISDMPVNNINDLTVGQTYVILDYGDLSYHGDYKLENIKSGNYIFIDSSMHSQGGELEYSRMEIKDAIKSGDIYEQD